MTNTNPQSSLPGGTQNENAPPSEPPPSLPSVTDTPTESGLQPSTSNTPAKRRSWQQTPPSRSAPGLVPFGPSSASGNTLRTAIGSRTHAPSVHQAAFFRPLSAQRLQRQRDQRPMSLSGQNSITHSDAGSNVHRLSGTSNMTTRAGTTGRATPIPQEHDQMPPPSRGTDITTDIPDRATANTSPTGVETMRSRGDSLARLNLPGSNQPHRPSPLDLAATFKNKSANSIQGVALSPRSLSSFILPSREGGSSVRMPRPQTHGHEKLSSNASSPRLAPDAESLKQAVRKELGKNHEYFTGNTVFCWGGRLQNTRDRPINIATCLLVALPTGLFFAYSGPWLWLNISPAIPIVFAYIVLICLSSFFHASVTDPGILPRNLHPFPAPNTDEDPLAVGPATTEWTMVVSALSRSSAMEVPTKYCKSCNIWRPPRAHHCRVCDNCIETQDHHCVWLNNCVGRRNYRHFFTFVSTGTLLGFYLLGASLAHLLILMDRNDIGFGTAIDQNRVVFAMFVYGIIVTPYPASLLGYHIFLISRAETTREYLNSHKFLAKDRHRPFTQGSAIKNFLAVLLRPRAPTYLRFKSYYEEGDQRFGQRKDKRTAPLTKEMQGGGAEVEMQDVRSSPAFQGPIGRGPIFDSSNDAAIALQRQQQQH